MDEGKLRDAKVSAIKNLKHTVISTNHENIMNERFF